MKKYIAVAGNVGAGKTSLVEFLTKRYGLKPFYEPNDTNPYLADFYKDMRRWAFQSQVYFFAKNLQRSRYINKRDYATYRELYETILRDLTPPDVMIFLRCSVRTMRKRIRQRGREMEKAIPVSYLRRLDKLYEEWFKSYSLSPTIEIESDRIDYLTDLVDRLDLLKTIEKYL